MSTQQMTNNLAARRMANTRQELAAAQACTCAQPCENCQRADRRIPPGYQEAYHLGRLIVTVELLLSALDGSIADLAVSARAEYAIVDGDLNDETINRQTVAEYAARALARFADQAAALTAGER